MFINLAVINDFPVWNRRGWQHMGAGKSPRVNNQGATISMGIGSQFPVAYL